ncbi:DUF3971 domain-containing protein [Gammaproteobacteria bacterium]|nr:DUF3971 domain-containing protein [Gammaproteobacteria bacterium]
MNWRAFNPVLSIETLEHDLFLLQGVTVELDFWNSLLNNDLVLRRVALDQGELFLYQILDMKRDSLASNLPKLNRYIEMLIESRNMSIDLKLRDSNLTTNSSLANLSVTAVFHNNRQKLRAELSYPNTGIEAFSVLVDKIDQPWSIAPRFLVQTKGVIALDKLIPGITKASIECVECRWQGNLDEGFGELSIFARNKQDTSEGEIESAATINLKGSNGSLGGRISNWVVSNQKESYRFEPIWFDYLPYFVSHRRFEGFEKWISDQSSSLDIRFFSESLDLARLSDLAKSAFPGNEIVSSWLSGLNLRGGLGNISGYLDLQSGFGLVFDLVKVHLDSHKGIPEIENLFAQTYFHTNGFRVYLDSSDTTVGFPNVFDDKWRVETLKGEISSWFDKSYFSIVDRNISAKFPELRTTGRFALSRPSEEHQRSLTLFFKADRLSISDRSGFIPNNLPEGLTGWLDSSPRSGDLKKLSFAYHGLTRFLDYPNSRRIELKSDYQNLEIKYYEDWPLVKNADGNIHLAGPVTRIIIDRAKTSGIENFSAEMLLDNAGLNLNAEVEFAGDRNDFLTFFLTSPLKKELPYVSEDWQIKGDITGDFTLSFPIYNFDYDKVDLLLNFRLNQLDFLMPDYNLSFEALKGAGDFRLPHHLAGSFEGELFDQEVLIGAESQSDSLDFIFRGIGSPKLVSSLTDLSLQGISEGQLNYCALINFSVVDNVNSTLKVTSDLTGFGVNLPKPFGKLRQESTNIELDFEFHDDRELVLASYGEHRANLVLEDSFISRGVIAFSSDAIPRNAPDNAVYLTGRLGEIDIEEYLGHVQESGAVTNRLVFTDLKMEKLAFGPALVNGITINGHASPETSSFDFYSSELKGSFDYSRDSTFSIDLEELNLAIFEFADLTEELGINSDIKKVVSELPDVIFNVDKLESDREDLGSWNFLLRHEGGQLEFYPLAFEIRGLFVDEAFLRWDLDKNISYFNGSLASDDLGTVLERWDFKPSIVAKKTNIDFEFSWDGSPLSFDLLNLRGTADFELEKGRFKEISPAEGGMKLASLLNFSRVFGRISRFDFSDVRGEGLGFETVNARTGFNGGIVTFLEPMIVSSSSSRIAVGGSVNMINETLDNDFIVTLPVSESLPWYAAYLAVANPIAGLGVIVGERVLRKPIEKFSSGKFQVRGAMANPEISFSGLWDQKVNIISVETEEDRE